VTAISDTSLSETDGKAASAYSTRRMVLFALFGFAVLMILLRPWLPEALVRLPETMVLPWADWLDVGFSWLQNDLGLIHVTREIASWLGFLIDAAANVLYGKSRWPRFEALPWSVVAATLAVLGYWLGGWRLALLAGGTLTYAASGNGRWRRCRSSLWPRLWGS